MFFCISINCMDAPVVNGVNMVFFDQSCAQVSILPQLDLQGMGRFARVCKVLQLCSFDKIYDKIPQNSVCFGDLADSYDRCTKGLRYFTKKKNIQVFKLLWSYHAKQRQEEIRNLYPDCLEGLPLDRYMGIYYNEFKAIEKCKTQETKKIQKQKQKDIQEIQKQKQQYIHDLKRSLRNGYGDLQKLHDGNIDIASLFPHKDDLELLSYLCRNIRNLNELVAVGNEYIVRYPAETVDYLLRFRRFNTMMNCIESRIFDVNAQCKSGKTMLHHVSDGCGCYCSLWTGCYRCADPVGIVNELIQKGADVNAVDNKGMTALHYACKNLHVKTVALLLKCEKIDLFKKDKKKKKPVDYINYFSNEYSGIKNDKKAIKLLLRSYLPITK